MLDPVVKVIEVPCSQQNAFDVFVSQIGSWWPLDKNSVSAMGGEVAQAIKMDARVGGEIIEIGHDGTEHLWGTVEQYDPHDFFSMNWHIGLPASSASSVSVRFSSLGENTTRVELTHSNWEAFGEKAESMRAGYDAGWVGVFENAFAGACGAPLS